MNILTISQFNNLLCFRLEDMSHENNLLVKEQKETVKQLHQQNETLTMSFKVRRMVIHEFSKVIHEIKLMDNYCPSAVCPSLYHSSL